MARPPFPKTLREFQAKFGSEVVVAECMIHRCFFNLFLLSGWRFC